MRSFFAFALLFALACGDDPAPPAPTGGVPPIGSVGGGDGGGGQADGGVRNDGGVGGDDGGGTRLDGGEGVDAEPQDAGARDVFGASDIGF